MADEMDEKELTEIEERCRTTAPDPWGWSGPYPSGNMLITDGIGEPIASSSCGASFDPEGAQRAAEAVASFIVHAREDVPALLAEVRRLSRLLECARAVTTHYLEQVQERQQLPVLRTCGDCAHYADVRDGQCEHPFQRPFPETGRNDVPPAWCPLRGAR